MRKIILILLMLPARCWGQAGTTLLSNYVINGGGGITGSGAQSVALALGQTLQGETVAQGGSNIRWGFYNAGHSINAGNIDGHPEISFVSTMPPEVSSVDPQDPNIAGALKMAAGINLDRVSGIYRIGPDGDYNPPATITFRYSLTTLGILGYQPEEVAVYEYFSDISAWVKLENQVLDPINNIITVPVTRIASLFAIFGVVKDTTPPVSTISIGIPQFQAFDLTVITPETRITITAQDPAGNSPASGFEETYYQLVNVKTSSRSAVMLYSSSFTLSEQGTFLLKYWSKDKANNTELPNEVRLAVTTLQQDVLAAVGGLNMAGTSDLTGKVESNGAVSLSGSAQILGDVSARTINISGKARVSGQKTSGFSSLNAEPIYLADITQKVSGSNNNAAINPKYLPGGKFVVGEKAGLTLSAGTYYFKGMDLSGGCVIKADGKVEILLDGDMNISGGSSLNSVGPASALNIFADTASTLAFTGGGNLAAYVYAPNSYLKLTGNVVLGGHYFVSAAEIGGAGNMAQSGESLPVLVSAQPGGGKSGVEDPAAGPDPLFKLGEVYVSPNPAMGGKAPVFHVECGIADRVSIKVLNTAGMLVQEKILTGMPQVKKDGRGLAYVYEYVWKGRSGMYYYAIEAEKGVKKLKASGGFVVMK